MRGALVTAEIALSVVLLAGAGLLIRTVVALSRAPLGFEPGQVVVAFVNPPTRAYTEETGRRLFRDATERLATLPGVESAAAGNCLPVAGGCDQVVMKIAGEASPADHGVFLNMVDERYLSTLGIPVVAGRGILASDRPGAQDIALVSEAAARRYWPGKNPVGARIRLGVGWPEGDGWAEVVGVVRDVKFDGNIRAAADPGVYLPMPQFSYLANYLVVKASRDPGAAVADLRAVVRGLDPQLPLWDAAPMSRHVAAAAATERFSMVLLSAFGLLALALAAVGVYGVIAYSVAGRTRELGVRMALGAHPRSVLGLVFRQGFGFVGPGLVGGALAALAATRVLGSQLYEVAPFDPPTLVAVLGVIGAVASAAIWLPARRATRIAPIEALRCD
jgi:predicted permease